MVMYIYFLLPFSCVEVIDIEIFFYSFLQQGTENRATGSTDMNDVSSRSHAIFSVTLKQEKWVPSSPTSSRAASPVPSKLQQSKQQQRLSATTKGPNNNSNNPGEDGDWVITNSKFHFVDLAGSERVSFFFSFKLKIQITLLTFFFVRS